MAIIKRPTSLKNIKNIELIKPEEISKIREDVRKELLAEQAKEAIKELKITLKAEERSKLEPEYETVLLTIDVPAAADGVRIDGILYHHGDTVLVPAHQAASIRDIMQNSWFAEKLSGNPNMKNYLPPKTSELSVSSIGHSLYGRV